MSRSELLAAVAHAPRRSADASGIQGSVAVVE
jgi:hypothetical protein